MSLYDRLVLPSLISLACSAKPIRKQRLKVVPLAEGRVLEIGMGGGLNLAFYDLARVERVVGVDPSEGLRRRAEQAPRSPGLEVEVRAGEAEVLPFDAGAFDTIVCTFTLCSVRDPMKVLAEARRVLKPGGALLFSEHGLAPDAEVQRWQRRIEPVWKHIAGGCHLTRPPAALIAAAGFALTDVQTMYLPGTPRPLGWSEWGQARAM